MVFKVSPVEDARLDLNCGQVEGPEILITKETNLVWTSQSTCHIRAKTGSPNLIIPPKKRINLIKMKSETTSSMTLSVGNINGAWVMAPKHTVAALHIQIKTRTEFRLERFGP